MLVKDLRADVFLFLLLVALLARDTIQAIVNEALAGALGSETGMNVMILCFAVSVLVALRSWHEKEKTRKEEEEG